MSLLTIVQGVYKRLSFTAPTTVLTSNDPLVLLMGQLAQDVGDELAERWDWQVLKNSAVPASFVGTGSQTLFPLPADWKAFTPNEKMFSSAFTGYPLVGPMKDETFVQAKANGLAVTPSMWRRVGNNIEFFPALGASETVTYSYASKYWVVALDGVTKKAAFTLDNDSSILPERLIQLGVLWRFKRYKGLDYGAEYSDYENSFAALKGKDNAERTINMSSDIDVDMTDGYLAQRITVS
jgi:hypothetical protein